jgi:hypothetical protein
MKNYLIYLGLTISSMINAQEVITTSGGSLKNNNTVANWTIGETIIETISDINATVTSGFNQPGLKITTLAESIKSNVELSIFPNPTSQFVNIKYGGQLPIKARILTIDGKVLSILEIKEQPSQLDFSDKKSGVYIIEITDKSGISNKYRIVKQ